MKTHYFSINFPCEDKGTNEANAQVQTRFVQIAARSPNEQIEFLFTDFATDVVYDALRGIVRL